MDRETFLLTREKIQAGMEEKRADMSAAARAFSMSRMAAGVLPFAFSALKGVVFDQKRTLAKSIFKTVGLRLLGPIIARGVWGLFSKAKPAIS